MLLLSARNALLSRRILIDGWPKAGEATGSDAHAVAVADTRARFAQLAFGRFASPSAISPEAAMAAAHALLEDSGVPELEAQVRIVFVVGVLQGIVRNRLRMRCLRTAEFLS